MPHLNLVITNIVTNTMGLLISIVGIVLLVMTKNIRGRFRNIMLSVYIGNLLLMICNFAEIGIYIHNEPGFRIPLTLVAFLQFLLGILLEYFFTNYIYYSIEEKDVNLDRVKRGTLIYYIIVCATVVVSIFNRMYFYIDENQMYQRGEYYWVSQLFALIGILILCMVCMHYRDLYSKREIKLLRGYLGLPILAVLIQSVFSGLYFMTILGILMGTILFVQIIVRQEKNRKEQENEISQMQVKIMLSQIQPHFLYNSLTTAQYLCDTDPEKAAKALEHLTQFLRGNIDSLKMQGLVPFERERFHVENYLFLEFLRFGEKLKVIWDVQCSDFSLPTLTVQPIVENAVKYGVLQKPEGGIVHISTSQDAKNYYIDVVDDGVGFDMMETKYDGRTHIGLTNVKKRLEDQCNGSLHATSVLGKGTSVRITIPKEK